MRCAATGAVSITKAITATARAKAGSRRALKALGVDDLLASNKLDAKLAKCVVIAEATPYWLAVYAQQGPEKEKVIERLLADKQLMIRMLVADGPVFRLEAVHARGIEGAQELRDQESAAKAKADQLRSDWQEAPRGDGNPEGLSGEMTRSDAYAILGLEEGASEEQITAAHGRLIQRLHPDRGGSTFLAAKINQAKDLLLG